MIDFGIARTFAAEKTKDTTPLGSPGYAAPEQYGRAQTDQRADVYGLGATLQTIFTSLDPLELAAGEPSRNPKRPSPALRKILDEMLTPEVEQRPTDMQALGLCAKPHRRRKPVTTHSDPGASFAPNLLNREFTAPAPKRKWVTDITAIPTAEGWTAPFRRPGSVLAHGGRLGHGFHRG